MTLPLPNLPSAPPSMIGRTYLERGAPVVVLVRWGTRSSWDEAFARLDGSKPRGGPRNVLIRRADGTEVVRPFRGLRVPSAPPNPKES